MEDVKSVRAASSLWAKTVPVLVRRKSSSLLDGLTRLLRGVHHQHGDLGARRLLSDAKAEEMRAAMGPSKLASLPLDALLVVFSYLEVVDVVSVARTCRSLKEASLEWAVWNSAAFNYLCRAKILLLDDFTHPASLSASKLRETILRTSKLDHNWQSKTPTVVSTSPAVKLSPEISVSELLCCASFYVSDRALILPKNNGVLVGFNPTTGKVIATYDLKQRNGIYTLHAHPPTHSIYAIVAEPSLTELKLSVLHIGFPEDPSESSMSFTPKAEWSLPQTWGLLTVVANTNHRLICMLFLNPADGTLKLFVVLDWQTRLAGLIETNLPYSGQKATVIRFSDDGEELVMFSDQLPNKWTQLTYSMSELRAQATDWQTACLSPPTNITPMTESSFTFDICPGLPTEGSRSVLYQYWTSTHSWIRYPGLPIRLSYILLYCDPTPESGLEWYIVQYYTTQDAPCASRRFTFRMRDPVTIGPYGSHGLPVMSPSFNHLCWIEKVDARRGGRKVKRRVLRIVTFPEDAGEDVVSGSEEAAHARIRTLKVPRRVLDNVCHLFVEPGMGAVLITTTKNELHRFQYA